MADHWCYSATLYALLLAHKYRSEALIRASYRAVLLVLIIAQSFLLPFEKFRDLLQGLALRLLQVYQGVQA